MDKINARKISRDALKTLRGQAMRLRQELGLPWQEIARVMGLNTTTVFGWSQRYAAEGEAGLASRKSGRSYLSVCTLMLPQEWVLRTILTSQAPSARVLPFAPSNRRTVRDIIDAEFRIDMPMRTAGKDLKRWWGYTPQRPTRQALEQKPWDIQRWMQEGYPLIASKAKQQDRIIYWADETAVAQDATHRSTTRMNTSTGTSRRRCATPIAAGRVTDCWRRLPSSCSSWPTARSV